MSLFYIDNSLVTKKTLLYFAGRVLHACSNSIGQHDVDHAHDPASSEPTLFRS